MHDPVRVKERGVKEGDAKTNQNDAGDLIN